MIITIKQDIDKISNILRDIFSIAPFKRDYDMAFSQISAIMYKYGINENPRNLRFQFILGMQGYFESIPQAQWRVKDPEFVRQSEEYGISKFVEWVFEQIT